MSFDRRTEGHKGYADKIFCSYVLMSEIKGVLMSKIKESSYVKIKVQLFAYFLNCLYFCDYEY